MIDIMLNIDPKAIVEALARLKGIPVAKVVRNASRDFAQASLKATPTAQKSKSEFYKYKGKDNQWHYLHESMLVGRKRKKGLIKQRIYKGWSRASWLGVFRALGMSMRMQTSRLPNAVEHISNAIARGTQTSATTTITDYIHFDNFGKGNDTRTEAIARAGFELAAKRMTSETSKMLARQWSGQGL